MKFYGVMHVAIFQQIAPDNTLLLIAGQSRALHSGSYHLPSPLTLSPNCLLLGKQRIEGEPESAAIALSGGAFFSELPRFTTIQPLDGNVNAKEREYMMEERESKAKN